MALALGDELGQEDRALEEDADRGVDEQVEGVLDRLLDRCLRLGLARARSRVDLSGARHAAHTQSAQSWRLASASCDGCFTRKQDWQTNSPGRFGWIRPVPSPRSSGSGATSSSSSSSSAAAIRSFRMASRSASTSSGSSSSSSSSSPSSSSRLALTGAGASSASSVLVLVEDRVVVLGVEVELVDGQVAVVEVVLVEGVVVEVDGLLFEVLEVLLELVLDGLVVVSHCRPLGSGGFGGWSRRDYIEVVVDSGAAVARCHFGRSDAQQTPTMRGYGFTAAPPPGWISKCTWGGPPAALPVLPDVADHGAGAHPPLGPEAVEVGVVVGHAVVAEELHLVAAEPADGLHHGAGHGGHRRACRAARRGRCPRGTGRPSGGSPSRS